MAPSNGLLRWVGVPRGRGEGGCRAILYPLVCDIVAGVCGFFGQPRSRLRRGGFVSLGRGVPEGPHPLRFLYLSPIGLSENPVTLPWQAAPCGPRLCGVPSIERSLERWPRRARRRGPVVKDPGRGPPPGTRGRGPLPPYPTAALAALPAGTDGVHGQHHRRPRRRRQPLACRHSTSRGRWRPPPRPCRLPWSPPRALVGRTHPRASVTARPPPPRPSCPAPCPTLLPSRRTTTTAHRAHHPTTNGATASACRAAAVAHFTPARRRPPPRRPPQPRGGQRRPPSRDAPRPGAGAAASCGHARQPPPPPIARVNLIDQARGYVTLPYIG